MSIEYYGAYLALRKLDPDLAHLLSIAVNQACSKGTPRAWLKVGRVMSRTERALEGRDVVVREAHAHFREAVFALVAPLPGEFQ